MSWSRALGRFLLSSHVVYLLLALAFVASAHWPAGARGWIDWLDNRTLALAYNSTPAPAAPVRIAVAEVPAATLEAFVRDPLEDPLTEGLRRLRAQGVAFHLFLPAPVWTDQLSGLGEAEALLKAINETPPTDESGLKILALVERLAQWHRFRSEASSLWFLPEGMMPEASGEPLAFTDGQFNQGLLQWINAAPATPAVSRGMGWQLGPYRFAGADGLQPLWWQTNGFQRIQGAPLLLVARSAKLTELTWQQGQLTAGDGWQRLVPPNGKIPVDWRLSPVPIDMMNLGPHLNSIDLLLIASDSDELPLRVAATANTLLANHYPVTPAWSWYSQAFWPLLLCLLTLPLWRTKLLWPALVGGVLLTGLLVATQLLAHLWYGLWLPTGALVLWLWSALAWRLWCAWRGRHEARLERSWTQAWQRLVRENINSGKLAEAETQLLEATQARESDWQLPVGMELAQAFEKQRRYDQAEKLYESIVARAGNYQGVSERLKRLKTLSGAGASLESTLIIDEQIINKPVLGRYEIQRELGRGAMGIVYLGRDPKIARMVAIKTLQYKQFEASQLPELKARFFREAEAAGRLSHPNIVSVFDVGEESDLAYIAMDYVPGRALSFYTSANRLLPIPIVYGLMAKAADALHYAHKHKIVHRDVKPGNLLYDPETGRLKVSDFGIARLVDNSKTRTGDVMGSPLYMSPEQLKGDKVSEAADIYSLGVTMYQLLTGKLPYDGDTLANLTYQILNAKHPSVRSHREELPPSATRITNKALQKSPADRFSSAKDMADTLRKSLARDFD